MKTILKYATTVALTGAIALAAAAPSEARNGRNAAAIGFGVGAVAGAAIASSTYNNGYYYGEPDTPMSLAMRMSPVRLMVRMLTSRVRDTATLATATTVTVGRASTTRTISRSTRSAKLG